MEDIFEWTWMTGPEKKKNITHEFSELMMFTKGYGVRNGDWKFRREKEKKLYSKKILRI